MRLALELAAAEPADEPNAPPSCSGVDWRVQREMFLGREQEQVAEAIVGAISVLMVDVLIRRQLSAEMPLHNEAVLQLVLAQAGLDVHVPIPPNVARASNGLAGAPGGIHALSRAERSAACNRVDLPPRGIEGLSAVSARATFAGCRAPGAEVAPGSTTPHLPAAVRATLPHSNTPKRVAMKLALTVPRFQIMAGL
jgi:hypothetical protein